MLTIAQVFADCARATYRVKCKPTLQNCGLSTRTITHPSQAATFQWRSAVSADRQADQARSRLLCIRRINGSGGPLVGRECQAECFVNSWNPAERRAEGANRVQGVLIPGSYSTRRSNSLQQRAIRVESALWQVVVKNKKEAQATSTYNVKLCV